jgi:hypothetical protein
MTQEARTTESDNRDNAAIRDVMHKVKELTVPDRATLALGIIGNLATLMNGRQMEKLLTQLAEEASKVQDVPPSRQGGATQEHNDSMGDARGSRDARDANESRNASSGLEGMGSVGQAGRGAIADEGRGGDRGAGIL